jgi:succinate dehydrogenase flavin-adding protein (antitoxin of CptAB toxin-antitoxin module)
LLLQAYLEERYDEAPPREQEAFAALLEQGDEDLRGLLMGPQEYRDPTLTALVTRIRAAAAHHAQAVTAT